MFSKNESFVRLDSEKVRTILRERGLKKYWVAEAAGVHKTTLRRWLSRKIGKVRRKNAERLASALTVSPNGIEHPLTVAS